MGPRRRGQRYRVGCTVLFFVHKLTATRRQGLDGIAQARPRRPLYARMDGEPEVIEWAQLDKRRYYVFGPLFALLVRALLYPTALVKTRLQAREGLPHTPPSFIIRGPMCSRPLRSLSAGPERTPPTRV
jgi:hypothetical protein